MKKKISQILTCSLIALLAISCNKKNPTVSNHPVESIKTTQLLHQLHDINNKHKSSIPINTVAGLNGWGVAACDAVGLLDGVSASAGLFGFGPIGGLAAGFIGGCCAVTASAVAYNCLVGPTPPTPGNDPLIYAIVNNGTYTAANPHSNPYESVGVRHNELIQLYYATSHSTVPSDPLSFFDDEELTGSEVSALNSYNGSNCSNIYNYLSTHTIASTEDVHDYVNSTAADEDVKDIINELIDGLEGCSTTAAGVSLINDYEEAVMANSGEMTALDYMMVMSSLAVAKHSFVMWTTSI